MSSAFFFLLNQSPETPPAGGGFLPGATYYDDFNRADSGNSSTTSSGHTWGASWGLMGITSNRGYSSSGAMIQVITTTLSDCTLQTTLDRIGPVVGGNATFRLSGLYFRHDGNSDNWAFMACGDGYRLVEDAGNYDQGTVRATYSTTPANGDVLKAVLLDCYLNGALVISYSSSKNQTSLKHGVGAWNGNDTTTCALFNDFSIAP